MILPPPRLLPLQARPARFMSSKTELSAADVMRGMWSCPVRKLSLTVRWSEILHRGSADDAMILRLRTTIVMVRVRTKYKFTELSTGEENTSTEPVKVVPWKPDNHHYLISLVKMMMKIEDGRGGVNDDSRCWFHDFHLRVKWSGIENLYFSDQRGEFYQICEQGLTSWKSFSLEMTS